jgi:hypothetical protein
MKGKRQGSSRANCMPAGGAGPRLPGTGCADTAPGPGASAAAGASVRAPPSDPGHRQSITAGAASAIPVPAAFRKAAGPQHRQRYPPPLLALPERGSLHATAPARHGGRLFGLHQGAALVAEPRTVRPRPHLPSQQPHGPLLSARSQSVCSFPKPWGPIRHLDPVWRPCTKP